jgi:ADP-ribose 1''-phosphate phosphatase
LLIPPCEDPEKGDGEEKEKQHWIACLFTSAGYGKRKDGPDVILENSGKAMRDLLGQVERLGCLAAGEGDELEGKREEGNGGTKRIAGLRMCRINSGLFGVEWERTEAVLSGIELEEGWPGEVEVWWMED